MYNIQFIFMSQAKQVSQRYHLFNQKIIMFPVITSILAYNSHESQYNSPDNFQACVT